MRRAKIRGLDPFRYGLIALIVVLIGTYLGFTKSIPFRHHYTVNAVFNSANNLRPNSPVRIAGVNIGKVTKIRFVHPGEPGAVVTMRVDKKGLPIHKDATFTVRPRIFLEGNFFVDVHPGSPSSPTISDGDTIPINQTAAPVQLDQILTTLQSATREDLKKLLKELSKGFEGQGAAGYNRSIKYWKGAYKGSAIVNDASLGILQHDLSNYIKNAGQVAISLDRNPGALKSLITDFNTAAHAFGVKKVQLEAAIAELPRTLAAGRPALAALNRSFPPLRRFIKDFRPAVRSSGPALAASTPFAHQARLLVGKPELQGLVHDLRPTVPPLIKLNKSSLPLLEETRTASSCQNEVIIPWSHDKLVDNTFPAHGPVYQESTKFLPGIAGESMSGDANGQWFRVLLSAGNFAYPAGTDTFFLSTFPILGENPPGPAPRPPLNPTTPCETQKRPDLRTIPGGPPAGEKRVTLPNTPKAHAAYAKAQLEAVKWLRKQLKTDKLGKLLSVSNVPLKASQIPQLAAVAKKLRAR